MIDSFPILEGKMAVVADDEEILREATVEILKSYGVECLEANNGKEALDLIEGHQVDFLISDVRMPGGSGIELLKDLSDKKIFLDRPIVMVTAYSDLTLEQAQNFGAITIVEKPYSVDDVLKVIADSLSLSGKV